MTIEGGTLPEAVPALLMAETVEGHVLVFALTM